MDKSLRGAIKIFSSNFSKLFISFLIGVCIARFLGPSGKGLYNSIIVIPMLLISLGELGFRQSTIFHLGKKVFPEERIVSSAYLFNILLSIFTFILALIIYNTYYKGDFSFLQQILATIIAVFSLNLNASKSVLLAKEKFGSFSKINWIPQFIHLLLLILLVGLFRFGISGTLIAFNIGLLISVIYGIILVNRLISINLKIFSVQIIKELLSKGIIYAIALFIIQLNYRIDILLLKKLVTYDEIGLYTIGINIAEILWQLPWAIGVVILSKSATNYSNHQKYRISQAYRVATLLTFLASIITYFIIPYFIRIVYGDDFINSVKITRILLLGVVIFTAFKIFNFRIAGIGKPSLSIYIFTPCLFLKILFNLILVPKFGIEGAAWASNISYFFGTVAIIIVYSKVENIPIREILRFKISDFFEIKNLLKNYANRIKLKFNKL